jgi:WD40 repeat protein
LELVKRWIAEGAKDDTPADAKKHFDAEHPPVYPRLPVVSSLDYSADGNLIAVAGFHEVLLHKADGSALEARLIGLSERVQSVRFSPDGKWLAAAGGDPARMGEVQIWDVATRKLKVSAPI